MSEHRDEEDRRLLAACLSGTPQAWERFVARFTPFLAEVCRRTLARRRRPSGSQEVDDMLQEVFLHLFAEDLKVLRAYRGISSPSGFLAAVTAHKVIDDRQLRISIPSELRPASSSGSPLETLEGREDLERLQQEMARLELRARLALSLQGRGASIRELGRVLGLSEAAAAQLLSRARAQLRAAMNS